jgi:phage terminase large subunit-like protein
MLTQKQYETKWHDELMELPPYAKTHAVDRRIDFDKFIFDPIEAKKVCVFIERFCTITKDAELAGQPLKLDPWQWHMLGNIYGWRRIKDGHRKYRDVYIQGGRKFGKTSLSSALVLYHMITEKATEAYILASTAAQAAIGLDITKSMVFQKEGLKKYIRPYKFELVCDKTGSRFKSMSANPDAAHGLNPSFVILDETHVYDSWELVEVMKTGMVTRANRLMILISTPGYDVSKPGYDHYLYAKKVNNLEIDNDEFFAIIFEADYEAPKGVDPDEWDEFSIEQLKKANPRWEHSPTLQEYLINAADNARQNPSERFAFRVLHLGKWVNSASSWLDPAIWKSGETEINITDKFKTMDCVIGVDLANTRDITAVTVLFWENMNTPQETYYAIPFAWMPADLIAENSKRDNVDYRKWVEMGFLETTPGNFTDWNFIQKRIYEIADEYNVISVAIDPWNGGKLATDLYNDGIPVEMIKQSIQSLSFPTKSMEKAIYDKRFNFEPNSLYTWQAGNVVIYQDASANIRIDKSKAAHKIDSIAATVNCFAYVEAHREELAAGDIEIFMI